MPHETSPSIERRSVELGGIRYVILRESVFELLCQKAGVRLDSPSDAENASAADFDLDQPSLPEKLVRRRQSCGLSQAELARRAGVRPETLNRIERGRVTPDFATIRKLVLAMNAAEQSQAALSHPTLTNKEPENVAAK
jgi:DNA-binding XRE family transcriptional regulator